MIFSRDKREVTLEDSLFGFVDTTAAVDFADCVEQLGLGKLELVHLFM